MRTFVFISDIPDFLLQPMQPKSSTAASESSSTVAAESHIKANRDPRFERLRRLLSLHTSGVMLVMHLENKPFALALYASEQEALAACKTTIIPERTSHWQKINETTRQADMTEASNTTNKPKPLKLRIVQKEMPRPIEAVYTPTITIEGSEIKKDDLVLTRGLELVYRGKAVARWCENTKAERDCPFGWGCHKIHLRQFQHTIRKRPRALISKDSEVDNYYNNFEEEEVNQETKEALDRLLRSYVECQEKLVPADTLQLLPRVIVPISSDEAEHLLLHCNTETECDSNVHHANSLAHMLIKRVEEECSKVANFTGPYFIRLSCPSGAPWDWSLYDENDEVKEIRLEHEHINNQSAENEERTERHVSGLQQLRAWCPYPAHGTQTLLERDLYLQQLFYYMNQLNRFDTVEEAFHALMCSQRVKEGLRTYFHNIHKTDKGKINKKKKVDVTSITLPLRPENTITEAHKLKKEEQTLFNERVSPKQQEQEEEEQECLEEEQLYLCVLPWLYLPTVGTEVSVFMQRNGNVLCGVVQRYAQLRLMLPFTHLLHEYKSLNDNKRNEINENEENGLISRQGDKNNTINKEINSELHKFALLSKNNTNDAILTENDNDMHDMTWDNNVKYNEDNFHDGNINNNEIIVDSERNITSVLTREIKNVSKAFMRAIEELRRYIASRDVQTVLCQHKNVINKHESNSMQINALQSSKETSFSLTNTSWCAHLALVLPTERVQMEKRNGNDSNSKIMENSNSEISENEEAMVVHSSKKRSGDMKSTHENKINVDSLRVAVLSFEPYHEALDASALYNVIDSNKNSGTEYKCSNSNALGSTNVSSYIPAKGMDVVWNTHKHQYIPLLDRGVLEKLKKVE